MTLTERQMRRGGSGPVATSAAKQSDGSDRSRGPRFSFRPAEHDLAENIIHLFCADEGAPVRLKGVSAVCVARSWSTRGSSAAAQRRHLVRRTPMGIHGQFPLRIMNYDAPPAGFARKQGCRACL